jgi:hypothetical protein
MSVRQPRGSRGTALTILRMVRWATDTHQPCSVLVTRHRQNSENAMGLGVPRYIGKRLCGARVAQQSNPLDVAPVKRYYTSEGKDETLRLISRTAYW